jgi:hypothetical protein
MIVVIVMILTEEGIAVEIVLEDLLLVIGIDEDPAQAIVATDTQVAAVAVAVAEETEIAIEEETTETETAEAAREIKSLMLLRIETRDSPRPIEPSNQPHPMNLITLCPLSSPQCHSPYIVFSLEFDSSLPCGVFAVCFCFLSLSASSLFLLKDPIFVSRFQRFLFFSLRSVDRHRRRGRGQRNRDRRGWSRE